MRKLIHQLRSKPEQQRRDILHIVTVVCALLLILLWILSLRGSFTNPSTQAKMKEDLKPFSALTDNVANVYEGSQSGLEVQNNQQ